MRSLMLLLLVFFAGTAFPQNASETGIIAEKIMRSLARLDNSYLVKLKSGDYQRAKELLENVYSLLEDLRNPDVVPMNEVSFQQLKESVKYEPLSSNRIFLIESASVKNHFVVHQLIEILDLLSFSEERVRAVEVIYPWIIDKNNSLLIFGSMTFSSEKEAVKKIIERYR